MIPSLTDEEVERVKNISFWLSIQITAINEEDAVAWTEYRNETLKARMFYRMTKDAVLTGEPDVQRRTNLLKTMTMQFKTKRAYLKERYLTTHLALDNLLSIKRNTFRKDLATINPVCNFLAKQVLITYPEEGMVWLEWYQAGWSELDMQRGMQDLGWENEYYNYRKLALNLGVIS
jgi:hypothetical protein